MVGGMLATMLVMQASDAAFTATTSNEGNAAAAAELAAPSGTAASPDALICKITVTWTATPTAWASGHRVERSTSADGTYSTIATVTPASTTSYADEDAALKAGLYYYYRVRAVYSGTTWVSTPSSSASALAPASCLGG